MASTNVAEIAYLNAAQVATRLLESGRVAVCQEEGAQGHEYVVQQRRLAHETQSLDIVPAACSITSVPPTTTNHPPHTHSPPVEMSREKRQLTRCSSSTLAMKWARKNS